MAKDGSKPSTKPVNRPGNKGNTRNSGKGARRAVVQIRERPWRQRAADWIADPKLFWGGLAFVAFVLVVGTVMLLSLGNVRIDVGQIMRETRISRIEFVTEEQQQTQTQRVAAQMNVPRVFSADLPAIEELRADLNNLPRTLAGMSKLEEVKREIRVRFGLNQELFDTLRAVGQDEANLAAWNAHVASLVEILRRRPMLNRQAWQVATQEGQNTQIQLLYRITGGEQESTTSELISRVDVINIDNKEQLSTELARIVRIAGFEDTIAPLVRERITHENNSDERARVTFVYDNTATSGAMEAAGSRVLPVRRTITVGQRLYARGEVLEQSVFELVREENRRYNRHATSLTSRVLRAISIYGIVIALGTLLWGYIARYSPRILSKPARIGWMTLLITGAITIACVAGVAEPRLIWLGTITPLVLIAVLIAIAYDQRTALAITGVATLIVMIALGASLGLFATVLIGIAGAIAQLGDLRERRTLIRMSIIVAIVLCALTLLTQVLWLPAVGVTIPTYTAAVLGAAAQSGIAGLLVGGVALFTLPFIERAFDITTGMTLIELRDPKQPILKELQQRAPGTYNHSLNVASIAESAAEAIGADALLTYVGCLYHDIGKMNKPGYFIENQSGGPNKHDKLTPAMSLLVIVGHVKDGVEMAREHGLPKSLRHFIEAHHGTTLVEYFYRRAREQAAQSDEERTAEQIMLEQVEQLPDEVDYRYPGPRPQTKEVGIVMLADAVESATRTLTDPTPARIDALVRSLANKRLMDGQFDECDLTFRELSLICESISKTVASIYHGRVRYDSDDRPQQKKTEAKKNPAKNDSGPSGGESPARSA